MKHALVSAPVLAFPNFHEQFLIHRDASLNGRGFALAQTQDGKGIVIAYNGRGLNHAKWNKTTTEGEALDCAMRKLPRNAKRALLLPLPVESAFESPGLGSLLMF